MSFSAGYGGIKHSFAFYRGGINVKSNMVYSQCKDIVYTLYIVYYRRGGCASARMRWRIYYVLFDVVGVTVYAMASTPIQQKREVQIGPLFKLHYCVIILLHT